MSQQTIVIHESVDADLEQVFALFSDHQRFTRLFGAKCTRIRDGEPEPDGLGSIRRIGSGPLALEETIVAYEPKVLIDYAISNGGPLKGHLGQIRFSEAGGKTVIDYTVRFGSAVPGLAALVAAVLRRAWRRNAPPIFKKLEDARA